MRLIIVIYVLVMLTVIATYKTSSEAIACVKPEQTIVVQEEKTDKEKLVEFARLKAKEYKLSPSATKYLEKTIDCESSWNIRAYNGEDNHWDGNNGSHGVSQFSKTTFKHYSKKAGLVNADVYNPYHSIETMVYMFKNGEAEQWTCYRKLSTK